MTVSAHFNTLSELRADTQNWAAGTRLIVHDLHATYVVVPGPSALRHLQTQGGKTLEVQPSDDGLYSLRAFGAVSDGVTDAGPAIEKFLDAIRFANDAGIRNGGVFDGDFLTNKQIVLNRAATYRATGKITAGPSFPLDAPLLVISGSNAEAIDFYLDCNKRSAGILNSGGQNRIVHPVIERFRFRGIDLSSVSAGDSFVNDPFVTQILRSDQDFASDAKFDGTGIYFNRADDHVIGGETRYCGICVEFSENAATAWLIGHHPYNGRPAGDLGGPRVNPKIVVVREGASGINIHDCYLDNGQIDLYSPAVSIKNCRFLLSTANVTYAPAYIIGVFANGQQQPYQLAIDTDTLASVPQGYETISYRPLGPNTWRGEYGQVSVPDAVALRATSGFYDVFHLADAVNTLPSPTPYLTVLKPNGVITTQWKIGDSSPVSVSYTPTQIVASSDNFRLSRSAAGASCLYFGSTGTTGITDDGASGLVFRSNNTARLELLANGTLRPTPSNTHNLGGPSNLWKQVFAGIGAINTSDRRVKTDVRDLSEIEREVASNVKKLIRAYRFRDAVREKGDGARIRFGAIAQDVANAFQRKGLDPFAYGIVCRDQWDAEMEIAEPPHDDNGNPTGDMKTIRPAKAAGEAWGLRYDELFAFILAVS